MGITSGMNPLARSKELSNAFASGNENATTLLEAMSSADDMIAVDVRMMKGGGGGLEKGCSCM
jgi:hypothetical protein